jgi:hypothetical protein
MKQVRVTVGVLGLVLTAVAASANVPKEATLFGQKYTLSEQPLTGKWKNGPATVKPEDGTHMSGGITLVLGETPDKDRLFVSTAHNAGWTGAVDQLFMLTGSDPATGEFNAATSNVTQFFGGGVDLDRGGRIANVTFISDEDTGKKKDFNIALNTFTGEDYIRFYDLDTMTGDYIGDSLLSFNHRSGAGADEEKDPNSPFSGFMQGVAGPAGTLLFMGRGEGAGPHLALFDLKEKKFLNALTNLGTATESQATPFDIALDPWDIELLSGNEYLLLGSEPADLNANPTRQGLYRVALTMPSDLAAVEPEAIKAEVKAYEEIYATTTDDDGNVTVTKDVLGSRAMVQGPDGEVEISGISSLAVGRAGRLYFRTRDGRLITANPVPAPTAGN